MKSNYDEITTRHLQDSCRELEIFLQSKMLLAMPQKTRKLFLEYNSPGDEHTIYVEKPEILDDDIILKFHFGTPKKGNITVSYRLKQISKLFDAIVQDSIEQLKAAGVIELEDKASTTHD